MNNKFCPSCGNTLNGTEMTCPKCGGPVPQQAPVQPMAQPVQQAPVAPVAPTAPAAPVAPVAQAQPMAQPAQQVPTQPNYGQQPMAQPNYGQQPVAAAGDMPMTYHNVYMILMVIMFVMNIINMFNGEEVEGSTFVTLGLIAAMLFGLFKRKKFGRILAIVYNVLLTIGGALFTLAALVFQDAFNQLGLGVLSGSFTIIFLAMGIGLAVWGICTIIYYNKRAKLFN